MSHFQWYADVIPKPGEEVSGDAYAIVTLDDGLLIAGIDGLGHGEKAHEAAHTAQTIINAHAAEAPMELMQRCNRVLTSTRGAVITLARIAAATGVVTWLGVGNVNAVIQRSGDEKRDHLLLRGGVVGYRMPGVRAFTTTMTAGDMLVMVSDGIRSAFSDDIPLNKSVENATSHLMEKYRRGTDDALVIVTRYAGDVTMQVK